METYNLTNSGQKIDASVDNLNIHDVSISHTQDGQVDGICYTSKCISVGGASYLIKYYKADGNTKFHIVENVSGSSSGAAFLVDSPSDIANGFVSSQVYGTSGTGEKDFYADVPNGKYLAISYYVLNTLSVTSTKKESKRLNDIESVTDSTKDLADTLGDAVEGVVSAGAYLYKDGTYVSYPSNTDYKVVSYDVNPMTRYKVRVECGSNAISAVNGRCAIGLFDGDTCCIIVKSFDGVNSVYTADVVVPYGVNKLKVSTYRGSYEVIEYDQNGASRRIGDIEKKIFTDVPTDYSGDDIMVFQKGICIGDSLTDGYFNDMSVGNPQSSGSVIRSMSYPYKLHMMTNIEITNMGDAGETSKSWYDAHMGEGSTETYSGYQFAIIQLGVNDALKGIDGVVGFSDASKSAFEAIISKLKTSSNGIKIFVANIMPAYSYSSEVIKQTSADIKSYFEDYDDENVIFLDMEKYAHTYDGTQEGMAYNCGHLSSYGYYRLALDYKNYISWYINRHKLQFRDVQHIG